MANGGGNQAGKMVIKVEGMTCGHCKSAVERAVREMDGVLAAEVSLEDKTLTLELDTDRVTLAAIREVIEEEGYTVV